MDRLHSTQSSAKTINFNFFKHSPFNIPKLIKHLIEKNKRNQKVAYQTGASFRGNLDDFELKRTHKNRALAKACYEQIVSRRNFRNLCPRKETVHSCPKGLFCQSRNVFIFQKFLGRVV
jgi:hypothetical protein